MNGTPPRLMTALLRCILPADDVGASIRGDLREEFANDTSRWRRTRYAGAALALALRYGAARLGRALTRLASSRRREAHQHGRFASLVAHPLKDAWRGLRRRPAFAAASIGLLTCGFAATSIVTSFVDAVLFRPLPLIPDLGSVVRVQERVPNPAPGRSPLRNVLPADMPRIAAAAPSLIATAAMMDGAEIAIATPDGAARIRAVRATGGFFDVVGVQPLVGRPFTTEDEAPGRPPVALLSYAAWQRMFGGRADAIGSTLTLNRQVHTVIGAMPRGFTFPDGPDLYLPLTQSAFTNRFHVATGIARVRTGIPIERVGAEVDAAVSAMAADDPGAGHGTGARVTRWRDAITERVRPAMQILMAAAALVLLLAAANLAGLLADRTLARSRELTVRRSLGATTASIARLLIAEAMLLAAGGAVAGLAVAALTLHAVVALSPENLPFRDGVRLDLRVAGFTALLAALVGVVAGLLPALRARRRALLAGERSGAPSGTTRSAGVLVIAQIAAAMVLVCGAGLLMRSFVTALQIDPGIRVEGILTASLTLNENRYDKARQRTFFAETAEALRQVPGVTGVELSLFAPMLGAMPYEFASAPEARERRQLHVNAVSPGLPALLSLPVLEGRTFEPADDETREPVALLSRRAAEALFNGTSPIGRTIHRGPDTYRVIGVVADTRQEGPLADPRPMVYLPFRQFPFAGGTFVVAAEVPPATVFAALRKIVQQRDPMLPLDRAESLSSIVDDHLAQPRFYSVVVGVFGTLALTLAVAGLYAVIAFATTRRLFEFGVRSALGARPVDNLWMVYRQGLVLALSGVAVGTLLAIKTTHVLGSLLYQTQPRDPVTLSIAGAVTLVITLAAVITPALRAARVDPVSALRVQ